jgi:hypothetical protein
MRNKINTLPGAARLLLVTFGFTHSALGQHFRSLLMGALVLLSAGIVRAESYPTNIFQVVAQKTTSLLTTPMSTAQRQIVHANNFYQLPPSVRPLYLQAVACDVGVMIAHDAALSPEDLFDYLMLDDSPVAGGGTDIGSGFADLHTTVWETMRQLNFLIAGQVASNPLLLQAIDAGAIESTFWNGTDWATGW